MSNSFSAPTSPFMAGGGGMTGFGDMLDERLLRERIIWLEGEVRDENSNRIAKQLQVLAAEDPERDITLYINSPGGSVTAGMVIYDTMQLIPNDVATISMGLAASMGQFLLCAGAKGKRYATPNTRIMMHQPLGGIGGTASDIKIQAEQMLLLKKRLAQLIADHSGQDLATIEADSDRDRWFMPEEAKAYGLIDHVYTSAADAPASSKKSAKGEDK
ncbi:MAG: ATP-dependent Clp protease proteolytic subunit [Candidatus Nanopelagicales bacterium]|nr:ATP-dependent Clp protease proteolytic subunit [Candidatus Nanopelagicales bacterium]